jgi:divalent metal cation (Fe/Co/Zn/Cd) transporter
LFVTAVEVDASPWAFGILLVSIVVDISRSRALGRLAHKYQSQALEADVLHFGTDIWSSVVVIVGLLLVKIGEWTAQTWLSRADAIAALGVALISIVVSLRLGRRASDVLFDKAPVDLAEDIQQCARQVDGVLDADKVRVRRVGPTTFVDMSIAVGRGATLEESHHSASEVEAAVQSVLPRAEVLVHVDPVRPHDESLYNTVRGLAAAHELQVNAVRVQRIRHQLYFQFHVEVDDRLTLQEAHILVSHLEDQVRLRVPNVSEVTSHIEPSGPAGTSYALPVTALDGVRTAVEQLARAECGPHGFHHVAVGSINGELDILLHVFLDDQSPIREAHDLSTHLDTILRQRISNVSQVLIHVEPHSMAVD